MITITIDSPKELAFFMVCCVIGWQLGSMLGEWFWKRWR